MKVEGFKDKLDKQTDISDCRVPFAAVKNISTKITFKPIMSMK